MAETRDRGGRYRPHGWNLVAGVTSAPSMGENMPAILGRVWEWSDVQREVGTEDLEARREGFCSDYSARTMRLGVGGERPGESRAARDHQGRTAGYQSRRGKVCHIHAAMIARVAPAAHVPTTGRSAERERETERPPRRARRSPAPGSAIRVVDRAAAAADITIHSEEG